MYGHIGWWTLCQFLAEGTRKWGVVYSVLVRKDKNGSHPLRLTRSLLDVQLFDQRVG